jgi:hypothetical protein
VKWFTARGVFSAALAVSGHPEIPAGCASGVAKDAAPGWSGRSGASGGASPLAPKGCESMAMRVAYRATALFRSAVVTRIGARSGALPCPEIFARLVYLQFQGMARCQIVRVSSTAIAARTGRQRT